jgi:hypothetical protein
MATPGVAIRKTANMAELQNYLLRRIMRPLTVRHAFPNRLAIPKLNARQRSFACVAFFVTD